MAKVELQQVSKLYGQQQVVYDINAEIQDGEFYVLLGPSGCGKSTTLRMIAGLETISSGLVLISGQPMNHVPPSKRSISMVFQNYALYPHLTVEENILFGLQVRRIAKPECQRRLTKAVEMLGIGELLKRKPRQLSGGQRQRVALGRAIVSQHPICLMDEPLSNLDAQLRGQMRTELKKLQQDLGITMIYVTHDQVEAMTMGDRMLILKEGRVQQIGRPLDVYNRPENLFVAEFIGSPTINTASGVWERRGNQWGVRLKNGIQSLFLPVDQRNIAPNTPLVLGIRPEFLERYSPDNSVSDLQCFTVSVEETELLGSETLVGFNLAGQRWRAKWMGQWQFKVEIPLR
ncbi:ABC transporter [Desulforamulus aquiferis]|nr:ABC transporter ATP-binding protein [Desulforamulus aquiferis]RYD05628.1 ABC transporter [Desulforamulus aquiferis]